jgi:hypothetical protein
MMGASVYAPWCLRTSRLREPSRTAREHRGAHLLNIQSVVRVSKLLAAAPAAVDREDAAGHESVCLVG